MERTTIGPSIEIDGEITGEDEVLVLGKVSGRIDVSKSVVVVTGGRVLADIDAETIQISGEVEGNVVARARVEISPEGRVTGDVRAPRIMIADGAHYKGNIEMT